jgi:hypothetical protein
MKSVLKRLNQLEFLVASGPASLLSGELEREKKPAQDEQAEGLNMVNGSNCWAGEAVQLMTAWAFMRRRSLRL